MPLGGAPARPVADLGQARGIGHAAFYAHMAQLMAANPPELILGNVVSRCSDDDRDIILGEMVQSNAGGDGMQGLHRHRFADAASRDRFYEWLYASDAALISQCLVQRIYAEGTAATSETVDAAVAE